jgi:gluconate 2-dehydrogenase gamma chain
MADTPGRQLSRRGFLNGAVALAGALPLASVSLDAAAHGTASGAAAASASGYRSLTIEEAACVEALVNAVCPPDALTPGGVDSGLAAFIDAHLAGDTGQDVHGQRELFRSGLAALDAVSRERYGVPLCGLTPEAARNVLREIAAGETVAGFPLASWSTDVLDPVLKQACFSGQVYEAYGSRMFVKLFG